MEHITDFLPITKEDIVYETHPKEVVSFKVNYVPVETYAISYPEK